MGLQLFDLLVLAPDQVIGSVELAAGLIKRLLHLLQTIGFRPQCGLLDELRVYRTGEGTHLGFSFITFG